MAVDNLPLIPSLLCQSVYYKGLKSVNILMIAQDTACEVVDVWAKQERVFDCILTYLAMNTISEYSYSLVFMPSSQHRGEEF